MTPETILIVTIVTKIVVPLVPVFVPLLRSWLAKREQARLLPAPVATRTKAKPRKRGRASRAAGGPICPHRA